MNNIKKIFDIEKKYLKEYAVLADKVISLENDFSNLSDSELSSKTNEFKERLNNGETLKDIRVESFATVRETAKRVTGMVPFKVQIMGGLALLDNNIAEMKTGEGKTLTSTLAVYTLALLDKGVHVITVNEYLASRDASEMGEIYKFLGLTVGLNLNNNGTSEKREAYLCDITYSTNSEIGFDYLRDNMVLTRDDRVQRGLAYAIIDEVDSILIDEARTPLIISGNEKNTHNMYKQVDAVVKSLKEGADFKVNLKDKSVHLLDHGIDLVERGLNMNNMYDVKNSNLTHAINNALKANYTMHKDFDYVVHNNEIMIVDQFTGRILEGRAYSDGLHQAIEAKEYVPIQKETVTMATITYQNLFRLYDGLSGMTGTAKTEEEEFQKTYSMDVIQIPTNVAIKRNDKNDMVFVHKNIKNEYMLKYIKERHEKGQPILIGTVAVESSEEISRLLSKAKIKHQVLNAKQNEQEADIIARAGQKGIVTIATNMAGRGTDIKLADDVRELDTYFSELTQKDEDPSGLLIIGTERHESRRIDNQLRGRSGRQGDKGESIFFISFDDDLLKRYTSPRIKTLLDKFPQDTCIESNVITKAIENNQRQVESVNYEIRKNVLKYDDILREQRELIYAQRDYVIDNENLVDDIYNLVENYITNLVKYYVDTNDIEGLKEEVYKYISNKDIDHDSDDYLTNTLSIAKEEIEAKLEENDEEILTAYAKMVMIKVIDEAWIKHIDEMQILRESVGLRSYGQIDPFQEYQKEGRETFDYMVDYIEKEITKYMLRGKIQTKDERNALMHKLQQEHNQNIISKKDTIVNEEKVGRNDMCPCGSGKKYKNCHGE